MFTRYKKSVRILLFILFGLLLPTQLGKHFWPAFSFVNGIRVDYFSPTFYVTDALLLLLIVLLWKNIGNQTKKYSKGIVVLLLILGVSWLSRDFSLLFGYRVLQYGKIVFVALIFSQASSRERRAFLTGLALSAIYMCTLSIVQLYYGESMQGLWWLFGERLYTSATPGISSISAQGLKIIRPYGTFSHPNTMGGFYLMSLAVLFLEGFYWGVIPSSALVLLSFSRIATIGLGIFMLYAALRTTCLRCKFVKIGIFILLVVITFVWKGSETSITERLYTWRYGVEHITQTLFQLPLLGDYLIPRSSLPFPGLFNQPIHNALLLFLSEWKIVGVFMLYAITRIFSSIPRILVLLLIFVSLFDHYLLTQQQGLLLLGVIAGWSVPSKTSLHKSYSQS
ncbi:MAG: hypothetical protein NUV65_03390 [Candidatus Roizmanbacteria bacterium]|nr:hypothetical protein [Candidatus Roizmanbacteria bacterium]